MRGHNLGGLDGNVAFLHKRNIDTCFCRLAQLVSYLVFDPSYLHTWRADGCGFESHPRQPIFL